jgi:multidrug efflux pump
LKPHRGHGWLFIRSEPFFRSLEGGYSRSLRTFLGRRVAGLAVLVFAATVVVVMLQMLPRELAPMEDRGRLWVRAKGPEGVGYEYMQMFMDDVAAEIEHRVPEAKVLMTQVPSNSGGSGIPGAFNNGFVRMFLKDKSERSRSQADIAADLQSLSTQFTAARLNITQEASIGERQANQSGVQVVLQAAEVDDLKDAMPKFIEAAMDSGVFSYVDSDLRFGKPELRVHIDRDKAQTLGVSTADIAQTLQASLSGQRFGYFLYQGKQYDVIGQLTRDFRSRPGDLSNISVRAAAGGQVARLDNVVTVTESAAPPELYRYNRHASATISGTLAPGKTMDEGIAAFDAAKTVTLDERFTTSLTGSARDFVESSSALGWVFMLALVLIYLVLAAQFESFVDPFVILLTVPLALAGALFSLWYFDQTLNVFSQIGLIMLVGLVTKNGILIVEFANQRRDAGTASALSAVREAAAARLRPILMTTLATILGIAPVALALGAGSESRVSMGIAIIGGLVCGGGLTLYVIPAMYVLLKREGRAQTVEILDATAPVPSDAH